MTHELVDLLPRAFRGAERLFRLTPTELAADGTATTTMETGPWMLDRAGVPVRGALGVLIDVGLGSAVLAARPGADHWGVTTEIAVDFCADTSSDGSRVVSIARPVHVDLRSGLSHGVLRREDGEVVAVGSQRQRYVRHTFPRPVVGEPPAPSEGLTLPELLGAEHCDAPALRLPGRPLFANSSGILHGGVMLCCAEMAASSAIERSGFITSSLRITYLRAAELTGEIRFAPEVLHLSRSLATVQVRVTRPDGKLAAIATVVREAAA